MIDSPDDNDQTFLLRLSDTLRAQTGAEAVGKLATQLVAQRLGADRVYLVSLNPDDDIVTVSHETRHQDMPPLQGTYRSSDFPSAIQEIFEHTIVYTDVRTDARLTELDRLSFAGLGAVGFLATSIRRGTQTMIWAAGVVSTQPRSWTRSEVVLFENAVERTWAALERASVEEALRQSETKYRTLFESMDEGFHISELLYNSAGQPIDWRYVEVNAVFERQTGLINVAGQLGSVTTPNTEPYWLEAYDRVLKTGEPLRFENYHADTERWYSAYASRVGGAGSRLVAVIFDDITNRKAIGEALRESRKRFESIANLVPDLLWDSQPDGATNWYNQRWLEYTGQRFDEAIGWGWTEAIHPDDRAASARQYQEAVSTGQLLRQEHRILRHDGAYRWFVVSTSPLKDEQGQVVRMYGAATDIHESKLAEAALQESEKRLRLAIEATDLATWEWNLETDQVYWNEQHFRLFGMQPRPNPLRPEEFMRHVHPYEQARIKHLLERAIAERGVYDAEFCAVLEDGSQRWMSGYGRITEERNGRSIKISGVMLDVDERRRAEDALRLADHRKDEFLAMLAHELRNPLSTLRSGLTLLDLTIHDERTRSTVEMMERQTTHLVRMVDDLLDVSRISQGKIELHSERVNLVALVQQAVEGVQPAFDQQGKSLQVSLPSAAIELTGDATRLTQVVTNLLANGARYTNEPGSVWLSLTQQGQEAILQVGDDGIGLAADQLLAIFELFVQVDNSLARSKGGLGLGLTLVRRLVEMHGGRVEAHSDGVGRGSTFTVHLPTLTAAKPLAEPAPQPTATTAAGRILVVDDNTDAAFTLAMLLKLKGYETHTRTSGRAGLEAAEALQPVAILLDIGMPELDGYATCRLIRAQAWGGNMVVIALTGYGQADDRQRTKEAGFDAHLVKPVDLAALITLLTDLLGKSR